jgi:hypothetical protein
MDDISVALPWIRLKDRSWRLRLRFVGGCHRPKRVTDRFYEGVVHRIWFWKFLIIARYKYINRL